MSETMVDNEMLLHLRHTGLIHTNEVVFQVGDLYVAEDVVTKQRRIIENIDKVIGEGRQILKG
jgi:hypothetical protein